MWMFPHRKVIFEKQWIFLDNVVGHLYNTTFEILSGGALQPKTEDKEDTESSTGVNNSI